MPKAMKPRTLGPGSLAGKPAEIDRLLAESHSETIGSLQELGLTSEEARAAESELERQLAISAQEEAAAEARVNMRWSKRQLDVIRRAADVIGVPYQTYIKQAMFERAIADITAAERVLKI